MSDVLIILWVPLTIAFMAVAFVVTLGAAGGSQRIDPVGIPHPNATPSDSHVM